MSFINTIRMKALEFKSKISKKGLVLSDQVKKTLASWEEKEVKVILLLEEEEEDQEKELKTYAVKKFLDGYDDRNMVYDSLWRWNFQQVILCLFDFPIRMERDLKRGPR